MKGRLKFSDAERAKLGEIGRRLGRKALGEVATAALPDTILAWYRRLVARKFDGSQKRRTPGRPRINREVEELIVRMAEENRSWGYDRIVGALANLGHEVSDQTVGNVLGRYFGANDFVPVNQAHIMRRSAMYLFVVRPLALICYMPSSSFVWTAETWSGSTSQQTQRLNGSHAS